MLLLKQTLGNVDLGNAYITSHHLIDVTSVRKPEPTERPYWCQPRDERLYSTEISMRFQVDGGCLTAIYRVEYPGANCTVGQIEERKKITIIGPKDMISRISGHDKLDLIRETLDTRDRSGINPLEEPKPVLSEITMTLSRPVFQPLDQGKKDKSKSGFGEAAAMGDIAILINRLFGSEAIIGEFTWRTAFKTTFRGPASTSEVFRLNRSDWNQRWDVPVTAGDTNFIVSFEGPQLRNETGAPPRDDQEARQKITITGEEGIIEGLRSSGKTIGLCAELDGRDIAGAKRVLEAASAEAARVRIGELLGKKPGAKSRPPVTKVYSPEERYGHRAGVNPDQGFVPPPKMNRVEGAKSLQMKPKPGFGQGQRFAGPRVR